MPGKLIYRCGRFLDQGYVTLTGGQTPGAQDRAADDSILQALRYGKVIPGGTGLVWTVVSEGRDVTEVLAFIHGATLPRPAELQVQDRLRSLADRDLPAALDRARQAGLAPTAARGMLTDLLDRAAAELSALLHTDAPRPTPPPQKVPRGSKRIAWAAALAALGVIGIVGVAFWRHESYPVVDPQGPSRDEIVKVAKVCYPDIDKGEEQPKLDRLVQAVGRANWREDGAVRDYRRALPNELLDRVEAPKVEPGTLCGERQKMWKQAEILRREMSRAESELETARATLGDSQREPATLRLMGDVLAFLKEKPIPEQPGDCAEGTCLPLVDEADITLKQWVDELHQKMANSLGSEEVDVGARLREREVSLRGELSLAGEREAGKLLGLFAPLWTCGREPACVLPLRDTTNWLILR